MTPLRVLLRHIAYVFRVLLTSWFLVLWILWWFAVASDLLSYTPFPVCRISVSSLPGFPTSPRRSSCYLLGFPSSRNNRLPLRKCARW